MRKKYRRRKLKEKNLTPLMRQYQRIKSQYPDSILFFRMGDFYEMFGRDAEVASKILEITLTTRGSGQGNVPLAGIPYHAIEPYLIKLLKAGHRVAICEQVEDPKTAKGIVKREVVQVITPGTVQQSALLDEKENSYLVGLCRKDSLVGLASVDITTGEFKVTELNSGNEATLLAQEICSLRPKECILPQDMADDSELQKLCERQQVAIKTVDDWNFEYSFAYQKLLDHFKVHSLKGFGCEDKPLSIAAAGAVLAYLEETQKTQLTQINRLRYYDMSQFMVLDFATQRNLELTRNTQDNTRKNTLIEVLDHTNTAMGARLLNSWLLHPLKESGAIEARLEAVAELHDDLLRRQKLQERLERVYDLERLLGRLSRSNSANARDLAAFKESFKIIPEVVTIIEKIRAYELVLLREGLKNQLELIEEISTLIEKAIVDNPPLSVKEGKMVRSQFNEQLDELKGLSADGKNWVARLENQERERTSIKSLKVKYNKVFGYFIEVTTPNLSLVPENYIRKQTMVNCERYITPELKEKEAHILGAEEKINNLEYEIFQNIRQAVTDKIAIFQEVAGYLARLDVYAALAQAAQENRYCRPLITTDSSLEIINGRHPVVEISVAREDFVPNDTLMDTSDNRLLIITGPNMAGKSTYLRQVALIVLMAQLGSFVPAESLKMGVVDRIFTRVGASDNLAQGESTFMVEMSESANILHNATANSLIILDEIGRGTSTFDGISIAWAIAEYIYNQEKIGAKTLFATHFFEMTELATLYGGIKNYNVAVREWQDEIIFLRKIIEGSADRSYGIQVGRLAGLPTEVVERAKEILINLEEKNYTEEGTASFAGRPPIIENTFQLSLFSPHNSHPLLDEIKEIDVNDLTPLQALNLLVEWQNRLMDNKGKKH